MTPCLADVNVLLALLVRSHEHHRTAASWFDGLSASEVRICRFVQLALIRLLGNKKLMAENTLSAVDAWQIIQDLAADERVEFAPEPLDFEIVFPAMLDSQTSPARLAGDAYLAAFAVAAGMRLVTLDRGFRQFKDLELELLAR